MSAAIPFNEPFTPEEVRTLARAVGHAPSVHNTRAWELEVHQTTAALYELRRVALFGHDPTGRDRLLSCGAALANAVLAIRGLGRRAEFTLYPDPSRPDLVGTVAVHRREPPTVAELAMGAVMGARHSYRRPFADRDVTEEDLAQVLGLAAPLKADVHRLSGESEATALAGLLGHAADVLRADRAYQRELAVWTTRGGAGTSALGIPEHSPTGGTLLSAGLVRTGTRLPDCAVLAGRLGRECVLVVSTSDDHAQDHVSAGMAVQRVWLAAVYQGLVGSVLTQPLLLSEVRSGLARRLNLPGCPQILLRLGYPSDHAVPAPDVRCTASSREPGTEVPDGSTLSRHQPRRGRYRRFRHRRAGSSVGGVGGRTSSVGATTGACAR